MLRGRRLPQPQSPLPRGRTKAPALQLHRDPARAAHFATSALGRNDNAHGKNPTAEAETQNTHAKRRAPSRLRIHKIGVKGDDWALIHARRSAQPATGHVESSLEGENPFGGLNGFVKLVEQSVREATIEAARQRSLDAAKSLDSPREANQADDCDFRSVWPPPKKFISIRKHVVEPRPQNVMANRENVHQPTPHKPMAAGTHTAGIGGGRLDPKRARPRDVPREAVKVEDRRARTPPLADYTRVGRQTGKGIFLKRLWGHDDAPSEMARPPSWSNLHRRTKRTPPSVRQVKLRDKKPSRKKPSSVKKRAHVSSAGLQGTIASEPMWKGSSRQRVKSDQPRGSVDCKAGPESCTEIEPRVSGAVTRQYELAERGSKPLFNHMPSAVPEALSLQRPHETKPSDAVQYSGELAVTAADIGPAESLQRSFAGDPVLMKARSLAEIAPSSKRSPLRPRDHTGPRFRIVLSRGTIPEGTSRRPQPSKAKPKSIESHMSELQIEDEARLQPEQPQQRTAEVSGRISTNPEATDLKQNQATDGAEVEALRDEGRVDTQEAPVSEDEGRRLIEPTQPPPDNLSVFEKLFADEQRTKGSMPGQQYAKLKIAETAAKRGKSSARDQQDETEMSTRDGPDSRGQPSIFRQLFPERAQPETEKGGQESPRTARGLLQPPADSIMVSLRNEVRNWLPEEAQNDESLPKPGESGSHSTVVVISGTSSSLMDTDFYRIAPEGRHVEGWAGGLAKVVQAHDSVSYEPLGQYYLMFHSRPSALAYVDEVRRLHGLTRKMLHAPADSGLKVARGAMGDAPVSPQPFLTDEERAAVRSFTLCSPHVTPHISVRMWNTQLVAELAKSSIADLLPALRPESSTAAPARVLLKLASPDGQHGEGQDGLTADELWLTLRDDGRERSAPWVLANLSSGIMPIKPRFISEHYKITVKAEPEPTGGLGGGDGDAGAVDRSARFKRFILTFTQPVIARRFVRSWHKRVVHDALLNRSIVVDAVVIM